MKRSVSLGACLAVALIPLIPLALEARSDMARARQPGEQVVTVAGALHAPGGIYELQVEYHPGTTVNHFSSLLVHAQPSGTLLLAYYSPDIGLAESLRAEIREALSSVRAPLGEMKQRVYLPYNPSLTQDRRITVTLTRQGKRHLLADGTVSMASFSFSTYFDPNVLTDDQSPLGIFERDFTAQSCSGSMIEHCCEGGNNCAKKCVCCQGPSFFCNLVTCEEPECLDY